MAKHEIKLTLVEMYAIKHALQSKVLGKKKEFEAMQNLKSWEENIERYEQLSKDIPHEEELISMFEQEISEYKAAKRIS